MAKKDKNSQQNTHYSRTMTSDNLSKAANYVGNYVLKGLGAFGKIATAPFRSQGPTSATIYKSKEQLAKERTIENKSEEQLGKAMTWASPLNYGAALATGNGLNARKGEEEVASWSPAWQAVGRLGELYVGPKAVKGVKAAPRVVVNTAAKAGVKPAKAAVVAREMNKAIKEIPNSGIVDNIGKKWFTDEVTFKSPFRVKEHIGQTVGDVIDFNQGLYGGSKATLASLTPNQRYSLAKQLLQTDERPVISKLIHMEDSGTQPISRTGFVPKDASNSNSVWNSSLGSNAPEIWYQEGTPYYSAYGYPNISNIPRTIITDRQSLNNIGINLKGNKVIRHEGEIPFNQIELGIQYNPITGFFDKIKFDSGTKSSIQPNTSLKFFERKPSKISEAEKAGVPKGERNFKPKWHVANYPGYQLKSLMKGSPLEKQLSKNGTININNIKAVINKGSEVEKAVVNKVLREKFAGQKTIDYNKFKKAVQGELIDYSKKPQTKYSSYGMSRLGFEALKEPDGAGGILEYTPGVKSQTFTFESPRIPIGSSKHYDSTSLGHSRTYITPDEPKVLHVMESQSDWGQKKYFDNIPTSLNNSQRTIHENNALLRFEKQVPTQFKEEYSRFLKDRNTYGDELPNDVVDSYSEAFKEFVEDHLGPKISEPNKDVIYRWAKKYFDDSQVKYLHNNYLQRQLQENLKFAAENGQTKMRYPTPETATKIEGYQKTKVFIPKAKSLLDDLNKSLAANEKIIVAQDNLLRPDYFDTQGIKLSSETENLLQQYRSLGDRTVMDFSPSHKTILKKYEDFPKLFQKLVKDQQIRTVTDTKGNTWYEVDVPKGYLSREWQFKKGGKMNIIEFLKNGSKIHIKEENKGKFTSYCGGKVTDECIQKGKNSSNPAIRKRATFADNARHFKHRLGGSIVEAFKLRRQILNSLNNMIND